MPKKLINSTKSASSKKALTENTKQISDVFAGYDTFIKDLKTRIRQAQLRAGLAVNKELVLLYWGIGADILARQREQGWGAKIIDRLSKDLQQSFPEMKGFSSRNLKYMRAFAETYSNKEFVQQVAAQIPWFHNMAGHVIFWSCR